RLSSFEATLLSVPTRLIVYIMSFWSLQDIIALEAASVVLHNIIEYYKSRVWNPDIFFRPWFIDNPRQFREILRDCGAVVSGSQITQFLDRSRYPGSDMDVFLRVGGLPQMGRWLQGQGYNYTSHSRTYQSFRQSVLRMSNKVITERSSGDYPVKGVFNYHRFVASPTTIFIQKIQLVTVDLNPIHHILFDFHSTAVMNFMTFNAVTSIFPLSTFILHKSYVVKNRSESAAQSSRWKAKYRDRGFRLV
ncbi:hypothetical protein C8F04DRAFT_896664, partial [Mycena alexandri]